MTDFEIVKDKLNIVDVISEDEQLQKSGGEWYGSHSAVHDSTGKRCLFVDDTKQVWKCFNCGEGGSVIDYVMIRDNCSAIEAVNWLCERYNIPRQNWTPEQKARFEADRKEKVEVRPLIKECFKFYHDSMTSEQRNYYHSRGLTNQTIDSEWLGYAPKNSLWRYMIEKYPDQKEQLLKTGLFFKNYDGSCKDRYSDRYVMPYWYRDEIVFSIGRSIDPEIESWKKYVKHLTNSDKYPYVSNVAVDHRIYGEDLVRGADKIIITEGIIDALLAKQAGYTVISPITVKFSNKDNERLAELCQNAEAVYLLNDNELSGAGEAGAVKTAKVLAGAGVNVKLGIIPRPENTDKIDLADFVQDAGDDARDQVDELLADAVDYLTYQLKQIPHDIDRLELVTEIQNILKEAVKAGKDKTLLRQWLKVKVKDKFDLKVGDLKDTYQPMLTEVSKEFEQAQEEQARKEKQQQHEQKMSKLKKTDTTKYLKAQIEEIRAETYLKAFQIKQGVSHIVLKDLLAHGKFYRTDTDHYYYFNNDTLKLVEIGDTAFAHYTDLRYRLNSTEIEYEYLLADLEAYSYQYGELTEVFRFAHYDRDRQTLYIDRNDCHMYRLNGETIELLNNGADGVLFISGDNEPFEMVDIGDQKFIDRLMIKPMNFIQSADVNLNKSEQQVMLRIWLDSLFFEEIQPTKPIVLFLGERHSGKSTQQRKIGKWLKGKKFNVQNIGDKEDSFDATISGNYLACFDNVDDYKKWLNDRLAQIATGQRIEKRELYTTNKIARYYPRCFITLSSREPKFKRDDVVDRLLLFRVQELENMIPENKIQQELVDNRNELWSELLCDLNGIVKALQENYDSPTYNYRMADFADLGWRIAKSEGAGDLWLELLDKMSKDKTEFLLLDDPIFQIIDGILAGGGELNNMTSGQLYKSFKKYADDDEIEFDYIKSAQSLAVRIGHIIPNLRTYFEIKRVKPNHRSGYLYTIKLKDSNS